MIYHFNKLLKFYSHNTSLVTRCTTFINGIAGKDVQEDKSDTPELLCKKTFCSVRWFQTLRLAQFFFLNQEVMVDTYK